MRKSHVPFTKLINKPDDFIDKCYYPKGFQWKDPRNMNKKSILDFCEFIIDRQDAEGVQDAFRFRQYENGDTMERSKYGRSDGYDKATERAKKQTQTRRKTPRARNKPKQAQTEYETQGSARRSQIDSSAERYTQLSAAADGIMGRNIPNNLTSFDEGCIDPSLRNDDPNPVTTIIDDRQMRMLRDIGYPVIHPSNGPNDGPPLYTIPSEDLNLLNHNIPHPNSPTVTRPRPRPIAKKVQNVHWGAHNQSTMNDGVVSSGPSAPRRSSRGHNDVLHYEGPTRRSLRNNNINTATVSKNTKVTRRSKSKKG